MNPPAIPMRIQRKIMRREIGMAGVKRMAQQGDPARDQLIAFEAGHADGKIRLALGQAERARFGEHLHANRRIAGL